MLQSSDCHEEETQTVKCEEQFDGVRRNERQTPNFLFLEVAHPSSSSRKDERRLIRSHVTREQHRRRREVGNTDACSDSVSSENDIVAGNPQQNAPKLRHGSKSSFEGASSTNELAFFTSDHPSQAKAPDIRRLVRAHVTRRQHRRRRVQKAESSKEAASQSPLDEATESHSLISSLPANSSEKLISQGAAALRNVVFQDSTNALGKCIKRLGFDLRGVIDHYIFIIDAHASAFENYFSGQDVGRTVWLPFLCTDPAVLSAIVLITVTHRLWQLGTRQAPTDLLRLRGFVIETISSALQDPKRSICDQLIVGVANMAIYEALFGSKDIYHVHMQGLTQMIRLRGGLASLGLNGLVERTMLFYDANCSKVVRCDPYFTQKSFPSVIEAPKADEDTFAVGVLER